MTRSLFFMLLFAGSMYPTALAFGLMGGPVIFKYVLVAEIVAAMICALPSLWDTFRAEHRSRERWDGFLRYSEKVREMKGGLTDEEEMLVVRARAKRGRQASVDDDELKEWIG